VLAVGTSRNQYATDRDVCPTTRSPSGSTPCGAPIKRHTSVDAGIVGWVVTTGVAFSDEPSVGPAHPTAVWVLHAPFGIKAEPVGEPTSEALPLPENVREQ
jgi:hypothetical protein